MVDLFADPRLFGADVAIMILVIGGLLIALASELRTHRIPNWLIISLLAAGFVVPCWDNRWRVHMTSFGIVVAVAILCYVWNWVPAGIAKLAMAIGLLAGVLPALSGLLLVLLMHPLYGWIVSMRYDPEVTEDTRVHMSPQFVSGVVLMLCLQAA